MHERPTRQRLTPMDVEGGAKLINRTPAATRQMIARRQIPFRKCGKRIVMFQEELLAWLDSQPGVRLEDLKRNRDEGAA
jgi:hypothetical protein